MTLGSLYDLLHDNSRELPWHTRLECLMLPIAKGILALHERNYIHRDLKSLNVLVTLVRNQMCAKLSDFGQSKLKDMSSHMSSRTKSGAVGTLHWSAPELLQFGNPVFAAKKPTFTLLA